MTQHGETSSPHLEVTPATREQAPILANLLELYVHDFSEFHHVELGDDGRFGYEPLPLYWSEPNYHSFLIRLDNKLAGLALIRKRQQLSGKKLVWDMSEFFIVRNCRRRGIGTQAAREVWRRFPGQWQVRVMEANTPARHFWAEAISSFAGQAIQPSHIKSGGKLWTVFSFESPHHGLNNRDAVPASS